MSESTTEGMYFGEETDRQELLVAIAELDLENLDYSPSEHLEDLFILLNAAVNAVMVEEVVKLVTGIRPHLMLALENDPQNIQLLDWLIDLNQEVMHFTQSTPQEFAEFDLLEEVIRYAAHRQGQAEVRWHQARIGLMVNYLIWLENGGKPEALSAEQRAYLDELAATVADDTTAAAQQAASAGNWQAMGGLERSLARLLMLRRQPNEALACLKRLAEVLHDKQDEPELKALYADVRLETGRLLMNHKKYKAAQDYLKQSFEAYQQLAEIPPYEEMANVWADQVAMLLHEAATEAGN